MAVGGFIIAVFLRLAEDPVRYTIDPQGLAVKGGPSRSYPKKFGGYLLYPMASVFEFRRLAMLGSEFLGHAVKDDHIGSELFAGSNSRLIHRFRGQSCGVGKSVIEIMTHQKSPSLMGRGFAYANAQECALKIQETLKIPVSSFSSADYLHGPISSLTQNSRVIFTAPSGVSVDSMQTTVNRIREITRHIYWIGSGFSVNAGEVSIGGATGLPEQESVIADSVVLQQFAMALAIKNNLNPDVLVIALSDVPNIIDDKLIDDVAKYNCQAALLV